MKKYIFFFKFYFIFNWKLKNKQTNTKKVTQSCPALCKPMNYTVHGILQARILEWVAIPFSRGIFLAQESNWGLLHCR